MIDFTRLRKLRIFSILAVFMICFLILYRMRRSDPAEPSIPDDAVCFLANPSEPLTAPITPGPCTENSKSTLQSFRDLVKINTCSYPTSKQDLHASSFTKSLADLLFVRGIGRFITDWESDDTKELLENTFVCEKHKKEFGYEWFETYSPKFTQMIKKKLAYICRINEIDGLKNMKPVHSSPVKISNYPSYINKEIANAILREKNALVQVGMPICGDHRKAIMEIWTKFDALRRVELAEQTQEQEGRMMRPRKAVRYHSICSRGSKCRGSHIRTDEGAPEEREYKPYETCTKKERSEYEEEIRDLQTAVHQFARRTFVPRVHLTAADTDWRELKPYTVYEKINSAKKLIQKIYMAYFPQCPSDFEDFVSKGESVRFWKGDFPKVLDQMISNAVDLFVSADSTNEQKAILSFVTPPLSFSQLLDYIPGLTHYMFKEARRWRKEYGSDALCALQPSALPSVKSDDWYMKIEAFISYLAGPFVIVDLPYGELNLKTSGGKVTIPATVRAMRASRIVENYISYLEQNDEEHLMLSKSTLFNLISCCTARYSKSLAGLDYYTEAATEAFDKLVDLTKELSRKNQAQEWEKETVRALKESKQYLRLEFRMHLKQNSKVADHCYAHALSDPTDEDYAVPCEAHAHDDNSLTCVNCNRLVNTMADVGDVLRDTTYEVDSKKNEDLWFYNRAVEDIMKYKAHLVRTTYNEQAKKKILDSMDENTVFITMDWAMKYLPAKYREGQTAWFGKRGISWHIAVAIIKEGGKFLKRTLVPVFQQAKQASADVTAILEHILNVIHVERPYIANAIIRSDNAGCYISTNTIVTMAELSKGPITVKRWIFRMLCVQREINECILTDETPIF